MLLSASLTTSFTIALDRTYDPVTFSGGGWVQLTGAKSVQTPSTGAGVSDVVPPDAGRILRAAP